MYNFWTPDEVVFLINNYGTLPNKAIQQHLSKSIDAIINKAKKLQLKKLVFTASNKTSAAVEKQIIEYYTNNNTNTFGDTAKHVKLSPSTVDRVLIRNGVIKNTISNINKIYTINQEYFDNIISDKQAYILGFVCGDGYNLLSPGRLIITLSEKDVCVLEFIKQELGFSGPIKTTTKTGSFGTGNFVSLAITNKHISKTLLKLGIEQNKSLTIRFPEHLLLRTKLVFPFLLGLLDSDGCVYYKEKQNNKISHPMIIFTGSDVMLEELKQLLASDYNINSFIVKTKTEHHVQLKITNKHGIQKLTGEFLQCDFSLPRKRDKLQTLYNIYK